MSYSKTVCGMGGIVRLCCFVRTVMIPQITSQQSQIAKTLDWYRVNMLVWDRCLVDIVPTVLFSRTYAQAGTMSDSALLLYSEFFPPKKLQGHWWDIGVLRDQSLNICLATLLSYCVQYRVILDRVILNLHYVKTLLSTAGVLNHFVWLGNSYPHVENCWTASNLLPLERLIL